MIRLRNSALERGWDGKPFPQTPLLRFHRSIDSAHSGARLLGFFRPVQFLPAPTAWALQFFVFRDLFDEFQRVFEFPTNLRRVFGRSALLSRAAAVERLSTRSRQLFYLLNPVEILPQRPFRIPPNFSRSLLDSYPFLSSLSLLSWCSLSPFPRSPL